MSTDQKTKQVKVPSLKADVASRIVILIDEELELLSKAIAEQDTDQIMMSTIELESYNELLEFLGHWSSKQSN